MTAIASAADAAQPLDDESRAAALWTFVHLKTPRFGSADALDVVRELTPLPGEDVKALAKRLRAALARRGVTLKHTHALDAASKLAGYKGWHAGGSISTRKQLSLVFHASHLSRELRDWDDAVGVISDYVTGGIEAGGLRTYRFEFASNFLGLQEPLLEAQDAVGRRVPLLRVVWDKNDQEQLRAAASAAERVRRRFEETEYAAIVDGVAAIQYCLQKPHDASQPEDPLNSELVVFEATPGPYLGDEVARGNELQCWRELATLIKDNHGDPAAALQLEDLDWVSADTGKRYRWCLSTLRATGGAVPQVLTRELTAEESARLLRRRNMAARARRSFIPEDTVRRLELFASDRPDVDVNWQAVMAHVVVERVNGAAIDKALHPETYGGRLSLRGFEALMDALDADNPQSFLRTPERKELALLDDDELLRALVSRVETVHCLLPRGLDEERAKKVDTLMEVYQAFLRMDTRDDDAPINAIVPRGVPYLVCAAEGQELLHGLGNLGLVAYGGLTTVARRLTRKGKDGRERYVRASRALLLDIDYRHGLGQGTRSTLPSSLNGAEEEAK
jgi:hypothetical protein